MFFKRPIVSWEPSAQGPIPLVCEARRKCRGPLGGKTIGVSAALMTTNARHVHAGRRHAAQLRPLLGTGALFRFGSGSESHLFGCPRLREIVLPEYKVLALALNALWDCTAQDQQENHETSRVQPQSKSPYLLLDTQPRGNPSDFTPCLRLCRAGAKTALKLRVGRGLELPGGSGWRRLLIAAWLAASRRSTGHVPVNGLDPPFPRCFNFFESRGTVAITIVPIRFPMRPLI